MADDDKLSPYRTRRDPDRTPEPVPPPGPLPEGNNDVFVIQEHHARRLHWDVRLERDGVLVSWAVPKGLPDDPATNHLAVHTEDHPLAYASFEGEIPRGEYGGGRVILWDRGRYQVEKWTDREVKVVLQGNRVVGRFVFFQVRATDWMVHRMGAPADPDWRPVPVGLRPMEPVRGEIPDAAESGAWCYEMDWGGIRAILTVRGGRSTLEVAGENATPRYPELRAVGPALGSTTAVLDGTIVALGNGGHPDAERLDRRASAVAASGLSEAHRRRVISEIPVTFLASDLLYLEGRDLRAEPFARRRELLDGLEFAGPRWGVSPLVDGTPDEVLAASRELGLSGVLAKHRDAPYRSGRSDACRRLDNSPEAQVLVGGWLPDPRPGRSSQPAALLVGVPAEEGLRYLGTVRIGLTARRRAELAERLPGIERETSPFGAGTANSSARWVRPNLAGRVSMVAGPRGGSRRLVWRGILPD